MGFNKRVAGLELPLLFIAAWLGGSPVASGMDLEDPAGVPPRPTSKKEFFLPAEDREFLLPVAPGTQRFIYYNPSASTTGYIRMRGTPASAEAVGTIGPIEIRPELHIPSTPSVRSPSPFQNPAFLRKNEGYLPASRPPIRFTPSAGGGGRRAYAF